VGRETNDILLICLNVLGELSKEFLELREMWSADTELMGAKINTRASFPRAGVMVARRWSSDMIVMIRNVQV
jgi:hypothetical protein